VISGSRYARGVDLVILIQVWVLLFLESKEDPGASSRHSVDFLLEEQPEKRHEFFDDPLRYEAGLVAYEDVIFVV
jgi:hypothetical protein